MNEKRNLGLFIESAERQKEIRYRGHGPEHVQHRFKSRGQIFWYQIRLWVQCDRR